jgi:hypothetical protein
MALSLQAMTTLANAQAITGVASGTDTTLFELLIERVSATVMQDLHHNPIRDDYDELYVPNNRQLLILKNFPIAADPVVTDDGVSLTIDVDFFMSGEDAAAGRLYRPTGWSGLEYVQGLTNDPVAGKRSIEVVYTAGWYGPADTHYSAGALDSLPIDLSGLVDQLVAEQYYNTKRQLHGLKNYSEGGISFTLNSEMQKDYARIIAKYGRFVLA